MFCELCRKLKPARWVAIGLEASARVCDEHARMVDVVELLPITGRASHGPEPIRRVLPRVLDHRYSAPNRRLRRFDPVR